MVTHLLQNTVVLLSLPTQGRRETCFQNHSSLLCCVGWGWGWLPPLSTLQLARLASGFLPLGMALPRMFPSLACPLTSFWSSCKCHLHREPFPSWLVLEHPCSHFPSFHFNRFLRGSLALSGSQFITYGDYACGCCPSVWNRAWHITGSFE